MKESIKTFRRRKRSAIFRNRERPKRNRTDIVFAEVLSKLIGFMHPEVGNLSWVSHETIASQVGVRREAVCHYLQAAELIGAVLKRYSSAATAHRRTLRFYPNYTEKTGGLAFTELVKSEPRRPKRLCFYSIQQCMNWEGFSGKALPDWQLEVIRLCATQKAANLDRARKLSAQHKIRKGVRDGAVNPTAAKRMQVCECRAADRNGVGRHTVADEAEGIRNGAAARTEPFLTKEEKGQGPLGGGLCPGEEEERKPAGQARQAGPDGSAAGPNLPRPADFVGGRVGADKVQDSIPGGSLPATPKARSPEDRPDAPNPHPEELEANGLDKTEQHLRALLDKLSSLDRIDDEAARKAVAVLEKYTVHPLYWEIVSVLYEKNTGKKAHRPLPEEGR